MAKPNKIVTRIVGNDFHVPFHDRQALLVFLAIVEAIGPDEVIILGDALDCQQISRFGTHISRLGKIQDDLDEGTSVIADIRRAAKKAKIRFKLGNHEDRLTKWAMNNPEMANLRALKPLQFFGLDKLGDIEIIPYKEHIRILDTILTHGHRVSKNSGSTALANVLAYGSSVMCGHTHRMSKVYLSQGGRVMVGHENGCLCQLDPEYLPIGTANWQHGFSIIREIPGLPNLQVQQIDIIDGQAYWDGRLYSA